MSDGIKSGMVLAAGLGTRMRPITNHTPKPLIKVAGRTMADRCVDHLLAAGVETVVLNISYLAEQIEDHFAKRADVDVHFSFEDEPLETGGGVQKALDMLEGDAFFVLNGDAVLVDGKGSTLQKLIDFWQSNPCDVLLLLQDKETAIGYDGAGDFLLEGDQPVFRKERPQAPYVFSGVQILSRALVERLGRPGPWSLRAVYEKAIEDGRCKALVHDGDWLHVGTPEGLELAEGYFAKHSGT